MNDPNDYDVITFDYYPERVTIDTIKFPCMFPGGNLTVNLVTKEFNFLPDEDYL